MPRPLLTVCNQIVWSRLLMQIQILNDKQYISRSVGFFRSQLILIFTICKDRVYPGSAWQGLKCSNPLRIRIEGWQGVADSDGGSGCSVETLFDSKFHVHRKFWINLEHFFLYFSSTNPVYDLCMHMWPVRRVSGKQCRRWSDAAVFCIWSWSTLFA